MLFFTNAPVCYDYSYVKTVTYAPKSDFRLIQVSDLSSFKNFQKPRYASGLYVAFSPEDARVSQYELPPVEDLIRWSSKSGTPWRPPPENAWVVIWWQPHTGSGLTMPYATYGQVGLRRTITTDVDVWDEQGERHPAKGEWLWDMLPTGQIHIPVLHGLVSDGPEAARVLSWKIVDSPEKMFPY